MNSLRKHFAFLRFSQYIFEFGYCESRRRRIMVGWFRSFFIRRQERNFFTRMQHLV